MVVIDVRSCLDSDYILKFKRNKFSDRLGARHKSKVRHQNAWLVYLFEITIF